MPHYTQEAAPRPSSKRLAQKVGLIFSSERTSCVPLFKCHVDSSEFIFSCNFPSIRTSPLRFTQIFLLDQSTLMSRAVHFSTSISTVDSCTDWFQTVAQAGVAAHG